MADQVHPDEAAQQHLDDHYGDLVLELRDAPKPVKGEGMTGREARSFLRALRPVAKSGKKLGDAAKTKG